MTILGPTIGFAVYLAVVVHAAQTFAQPAPTLSEAMTQFQQLPGRLAFCLIPLSLGALCGATGLVMVIANLAIQFLGQETAPATTARAFTQSNPAPQAPGLAQVSAVVHETLGTCRSFASTAARAAWRGAVRTKFLHTW